MPQNVNGIKLHIQVSCELNGKEVLPTRTSKLRGLAAMLQGTTVSCDCITQDVFVVFFRFPTTRHEYSPFVTFLPSD